jgi:hypothetical protein
MFAQQPQKFGLQTMSQTDMEKLSALPSLVLPEGVNRRLLPYMVDNSQLPYFRPLIAQVGLECGQASSIGVMFTYELNAKRGLPGNVSENQYPTHFAYNFINGGSDAGVNFWETFEILKQIGTPNVADYGGMATGGPSRWISGYDYYFNGMHNKIAGTYTIKTNTIEGLQTLKNWVYDHGNGSESGGIATFYSEFTHPPVVFPPGTPEAGKHVIVSWGNSPNHAMSIVGYNDSIRWDFNNDGRYTNNIDLNSDGIINISDWEIGGFKMANTYGSISGWGDNGFAYMMYKTVGDRFGQGGIWNNMFAVVDVKETYHPKLTAKINITFPCRNNLKLMVGVAADTAATEPEYIHHYPIYDFQGGCKAMQGDSGDEHIELGLDLNPLLTYIVPGQEAKFFLLVAESGGLDFTQGAINSFSLLDYTDLTVDEYMCQNSEVPIQGNEITMMSLKATINYDAVEIITNSLPAIELYSDYETQLTAAGGTEPFQWELLYDYAKTDSVSNYPGEGGERLSIGNNDSYTEVNLPFEFPFYGEKISKVYPTSEGFIMFKETIIPWPYYIEGRTYFLENKMIAPCFARPFYFDGTLENGIWYTQSDDSCTFRWKLSTYGITENSMVEVAVSLFPDGTIHFFYGPHHAPGYVHKFAGISAGDGENYTLLNEIGYFTPYPNQFAVFTPNDIFDGLTLTKDGLLSGVVDEMFENQTIKVKVTDFDNIAETKVFPLSIDGVEMNYSVLSGDDDIVEFGESFSMNIDLHNYYDQPINGATITFEANDPDLEVIDSVFRVNSLPAGGTLNLTDIFLVAVDNSVEDGQIAGCSLVFTSEQHTWTRNIGLILHAPVLQVNSVTVIDNENGILEPGETAQLLISFQNTGGAKIHDLTAIMNCNNPDLQILDGFDTVAQLTQQGIWQATYEVYFDETAEPLQVLELQLVINAENDFYFEKLIPLVTSLMLENYETGTFESYDWITSGDADWFVTTDLVYEGIYAARSGAMGDNGTSLLSLPYDVAYSDTISFYFKVSSEVNYDFLKFTINDEIQEQWSGEIGWMHKVYPVVAGNQLFTWRYDKDYSLSNGLDCAVLDYIILPARNVETVINENHPDPDVQLIINPNPFFEQLNLCVKVNQQTAFTLSVIDNLGRIVYETKENNIEAGSYTYNNVNTPESGGSFYVVIKSNTSFYVKPVIRMKH